MNRAEASGILEENEAPEITDPRSLSFVLEGQIASSSQVPAVSSNSEDSEYAYMITKMIYKSR